MSEGVDNKTKKHKGENLFILFYAYLSQQIYTYSGGYILASSIRPRNENNVFICSLVAVGATFVIWITFVFSLSADIFDIVTKTANYQP
jgi:hypothetical protein